MEDEHRRPDGDGQLDRIEQAVGRLDEHLRHVRGRVEDLNRKVAQMAVTQEQLDTVLKARLRGLKDERKEVELLLSAARRCETRGRSGGAGASARRSGRPPPPG